MCVYGVLSRLSYITGGDRKLFGDASYQLGSAFINNGDPQTALMVGTSKLFSAVNDTLMSYIVIYSISITIVGYINTANFYSSRATLRSEEELVHENNVHIEDRRPTDQRPTDLGFWKISNGHLANGSSDPRHVWF